MLCVRWFFLAVDRCESTNKLTWRSRHSSVYEFRGSTHDNSMLCGKSHWQSVCWSPDACSVKVASVMNSARSCLPFYSRAMHVLLCGCCCMNVASEFVWVSFWMAACTTFEWMPHACCVSVVKCICVSEFWMVACCYRCGWKYRTKGWMYRNWVNV